MANGQSLGNTRNRQRGAALAEFALLIPFYVVVIVGMLKVGRLFTESAILTQNSYEITRRSAETPADLAGAAIPAFGTNLNQIWSHYSNTATLDHSAMQPTYTDSAAGRQVAIAIKTDLKVLPFHGAKLNDPLKTQMVAPYLLNTNAVPITYVPSNPPLLVTCGASGYTVSACTAADPSSPTCSSGTTSSPLRACAF